MIRRESIFQNVTISVILPVYNVELWIDDCISSLKKQKLFGLEFIFIDDCSTDNSMRPVEAWAEEDERVRIIRNPQNMGSGHSRNAGIEAGRGEYYSFIDPDDLVSDDFYNLLYAKAAETGCDIIKGARVNFNDGDDVSLIAATETESKLNSRIRLMLKRNWPLYTTFINEHQTAIFKASLFADERVRYGSTRVAQDTTFLLKICHNTCSIAFDDEAIYYYRTREGAATSSYTIKRALTQILAMEESLAYLEARNCFPSDYQISYINHRLKGYLSSLYYASKDEPASPQSYEKYYQHVNLLVERIGGSALLKSGFPELDVYLNYKHLIPFSIRSDEVLFTDGLESWTDFLVTHPSLNDTGYYRGYATAMLRSWYSFLRVGNNKGIKISWIRFCKKQLSRLSSYNRCRILAQIPRQGFSSVLQKMGLQKMSECKSSATTSIEGNRKPRIGNTVDPTPKISVIIPMYKCADFIENMLDSVCNQSLRETELICVLDGADEDVLKAIEKRSTTDNRIICIEQSHSGAGAARNTGLDIARGDYLLFLDADDLFETQMFETMYDEAVKWDADTVMCSYTETNEWDKTTHTNKGFDHGLMPDNRVLNPSAMPMFLASFIGAPWNKLFRRKMIEDHGLRFSNTRIMNDEFFVTAAMTSSKKLVTIHKDLLTVRRHINKHSISTNRAKYTQDCVVVMNQIYRWLRTAGEWKHHKNGYYLKFKYALNYQAKYDYNEEFVDAVARTLSIEEPWKGMPNAKMIKVLDMYNTQARKIKKKLETKKTSAQSIDFTSLEKRVQMADNQINAKEQIRSVMKAKYGRDLAKTDKLIQRLLWFFRAF